MDKTETKDMEGEITTLRPCPFCGGEAKITQIKSNGFMIKCTRCLIQKRQKVLHYPIEWLKSKMIEDWNTRSELQKAKEENELLMDKTETVACKACEIEANDEQVKQMPIHTCGKDGPVEVARPKTETKEMEGETMLNKAITFRRIISNGNYSCVGIPYSDAIKAMHDYSAQQLKEYKEKLKEKLQFLKSGNHVIGIDFLFELIDQTDSTK